MNRGRKIFPLYCKQKLHFYCLFFILLEVGSLLSDLFSENKDTAADQMKRQEISILKIFKKVW